LGLRVLTSLCHPRRVRRWRWQKRLLEHWGFNDEVKEAARSRRRLDDQVLSKSEEESLDWMALSGERARRFEREAIAEIGRDHDLAGLDLTAVSTCPG
jgi:hypothetical protein